MKKSILLFIIAGLFSFAAEAQKNSNIKTIAIHDKLVPSRPSQVKIRGHIGSMMDSCIQNDILGKDFTRYTIPWRDKREAGGGDWEGMTWGQWMTSAVLAHEYYGSNAKTLAMLEQSVRDLLATQEPDGRLSSYLREKTFASWDIWNRKYALLGLLAWHDLTGDRVALQAACRSTDELIQIAGPGKQKLTESSLSVLESSPSSSILEPLVLLYMKTGKEEYLGFIRYLVSLWSEPNSFTTKGMRLVEDALLGIPPSKISSPKGYELLSCYEGLCELYRATGDSLYLDAVVRYGKSLIEREIMIIGSGTSVELWCDGIFRQTQLLTWPLETCVTAHWMKYCYDLLRLTGDPLWADQLEITLYNALLGAMAPDGSWWAYPSPNNAGERVPSPIQPICISSCCVANGPRGFLTMLGWSVMTGESGPVINLYAPGTWNTVTPEGKGLSLVQETGYPVDDRITITVKQKTPERYTLSLRIPSWSSTSEITVNGETYNCPSGEYARINRKWSDGDSITLRLDMGGRMVRSPGSVNDFAVMRGPIVLALDNRLAEPSDKILWLYPENTEWTTKDNKQGKQRYSLLGTISEKDKDMRIELKPVKEKPEGVWMAFEVPFIYRPSHFFSHTVTSLVMCDYASAGNRWSTDNIFRVWIPQPIYMKEAYPEDSWKILNPLSTKRPEFPVFRNQQ